MKKYTAIAALSSALFFSGALQAQWDGNFVLGVSGSYNWYHAKFRYDVDTPAGADIVHVGSFESPINGNDWLWGALAGYQFRCCKWLFGAELSADFQNHDETSSYARTVNYLGDPMGTYVTATVKHGTELAFSARFGYEFYPCMLGYLRAGIESHRNKFHIVSQHMVTLNVGEEDTENFQDFLDAETERRSYGFLLGAGLEVPFPRFPWLTVRGEYDYHTRNRAHQLHARGINQELGLLAEGRAKLQHLNTVKVAVVLNFDLFE